MDPRGHIYEGTEARPVEAEDAARLDGYLRGRSEADAKKEAVERMLQERDQMLSDANAAKPLDADG